MQLQYYIVPEYVFDGHFFHFLFSLQFVIYRCHMEDFSKRISTFTVQRITKNGTGPSVVAVEIMWKEKLLLL
jgi:hypothetical protein